MTVGSWRALLLRLATFLLPFVVFPGLPVGFAVAAGEATPLKSVAARQLHEPLLFGRSYRDDYFAFKLIATRLRSPRVLVLGSSRVMQFRAELLGNRAGDFYNAGGAASTAAEALEFVRHLTAPYPDVIIVGIDQSWLIQASVFDRATLELVETEGTDLARMVRLSHLVVKDWWTGRIPVGRILSGRDPFDRQPALGVNAIAWGNGFRPDGSYQYGNYRLAWPPVEQRLAEGYRRLETHLLPMNTGAHVDPAALQQISDLLDECGRRNIEVVGFSPPFAPAILDAMRADPALAYLGEVGPALEARFARAGRHFEDWTDIRPLGFTDDDMIDYFHPSERVVERIWQQLQRHLKKGNPS